MENYYLDLESVRVNFTILLILMWVGNLNAKHGMADQCCLKEYFHSTFKTRNIGIQ